MALTELALKNLKPKDKRYLVRDYQGLYIEVNPTGRKYWKVRYMADGQAKKVTLGEYPYISLKEARRRRDDVRGMAVTGQEPQKPPKTFRDAASEWYETHIKSVCSQTHAVTVISRLERFLYPKLGDKVLKEISAADVLDILKALQNSGIVETAHRVKQIAGQVFRYAAAIGEGERDITADLRGALKPNTHKHHGAAKTSQEAKAVILSIDAYNGGAVVKNAL
ncbi:MAG: integrase arm-type DNA-binding domain-containing protein, partial [Synergistaceae bacterium]|nr:integrase arm-type DNA-binding domain-containing protein [Synergistaceae bacterium]